MKKLIYFSLLLICFSYKQILALNISPEIANKIAEKIWKNECGGSTEQFTHWNLGENFASLGIGHFIWYPKGCREAFQETFLELIKFLEENHVALPEWLTSSEGCPWNSREEFHKDIDSLKMCELRRLLLETRNLQAIFIANRLERTLPEMLEKLPVCAREELSTIFYKIAADTQGLYALIDYLNFKGAGISSNESYKGEGWGLLQVLQRIPPTSEHPLDDFIESAQIILAQRVKNSPQERHEERWLRGWINRVKSYRQ